MGLGKTTIDKLKETSQAREGRIQGLAAQLKNELDSWNADLWSDANIEKAFPDDLTAQKAKRDEQNKRVAIVQKVLQALQDSMK